LNLALVSSDKTVRETTKRPHTIASYLKVVHKAFDLGFRMVSYQILGLPQERLESMVQTLAFNAALPVLLGASPFYRTPESPIARGLDLDETDFVRARLTAMAIETPSCTREDIYTLFVITRMINFLKGLEVGEDADLDALVARSWPHRRTEIGMTLLRRLAHANTLFFWTRCGLIPNAKFKPALFFRVLQEAGRITCQNSRHIDVANYLRSWVKSSNAGESH
jgi:hypothetical protein